MKVNEKRSGGRDMNKQKIWSIDMLKALSQHQSGNKNYF